MKNLCRLISQSTRVPIRGRHVSTTVENAAAKLTFPPVKAAEEKSQQGGDTQNLYRRLSALGMKKNMVSSTINEYIREGKTPSKFELDRCITELRKYRKPHLSLEIMEWMAKRGVNKSLRDFPMYLELVAKTKGIEEAEKYFRGLSDSMRNQWTYGALLNCYCTKLMEDQALALFKEMEELNVAYTSVAYSNLMSLYMKLEKPEKVSPLAGDMKKRNIELTTYIYCIWMTSCLHLDDVEGAERVFEEVKRDSMKKCTWTIYSNLAVVYVKAGYKEKAELALKKVEQEMGPQNRKAYHLLISLHAGVSNLSEVHRLWKSLKHNFEVVTNMSYLVMLQALGKLNDLVGLKDCYEEWESSCHSFDTRIAHSVIRNYLRHQMVEEAQAVFHHAKERSSGHPFFLSETFITYFLQNNQGQQALCCLEAAVSQVKNDEWRLKHYIIREFVRYLEETKDVDFGEEFCKLLKKVNSLKYASYKSLLETYVVAGRIAPNMLERIEEDGIVVDSTLKHVLQRVCPESELS
ncbi:hypothetical protein Leryth_009001 [Lithospermum erythrorhizon]|nr:hypothetical protein Leryth_009001 [Lithospermum erythrorhizon]